MMLGLGEWRYEIHNVSMLGIRWVCGNKNKPIIIINSLLSIKYLSK